MIVRAAMMPAGMAAMVAMMLSSITSQRGGGESMAVAFVRLSLVETLPRGEDRALVADAVVQSDLEVHVRELGGRV